jgi:hypothetical protein
MDTTSNAANRAEIASPACGISMALCTLWLVIACTIARVFFTLWCNSSSMSRCSSSALSRLAASVAACSRSLRRIWAIRVRLQIFCRTQELALFDLGIDSKLRGCDLLKLKVRDVCHGERVGARAIVVQQKTFNTRPVRDHGADPDRSRRLD